MNRYVTLVAGALLLAGCAATPAASPSPAPTVSPASASPTPPPPTPPVSVKPTRPHRVTYEVEGSAKLALLRFTTPGGGIEQAQASIPLTGPNHERGLSFDTFKAGEIVDLSATNQGAFGTVTCRITVDDQVVAQNTSSSIVGCDAAL